LRSFVFVDFYLVILLSIISFAIFLFHFFISKNNWGVLVSIFILFFCFGIFRFNMVDIANPSVFESRVSQKSTFEGITADEPSIKENNQQFCSDFIHRFL